MIVAEGGDPVTVSRLGKQVKTTTTNTNDFILLQHLSIQSLSTTIRQLHDPALTYLDRASS